MTAADLSGPAARLAAALEAGASRVTVPREDFHPALEHACPGAVRSGRSRPVLAALLDELGDAGRIRLPGANSAWDAGRPPLPEWIRLASDTAAASRQRPSSFPWRPELRWAADAHLTTSQVSDLRKVNRWLRDTDTDPEAREPVPVRERSAEIFSDEKHLERLTSTSLFAPGRLDLALLGAIRIPPPLAFTRTGDGPVLLVLENSTTYATVVTLLRAAPGPVGHVAWGCGRAFEASVAGVAEIPGVAAIRYYGDLDPAGLSIPARAGVVASEYGLPEILPAAGLYEMMLSRQPQDGGPPPDAQRVATLTSWLPASLQEAAGDLLLSGRRIPQEATGHRLLSCTGKWRSGLGEIEGRPPI